MSYDDDVRALVRTRRRRIAYWVVALALAVVIGIPLNMVVGGLLLEAFLATR